MCRRKCKHRGEGGSCNYWMTGKTRLKQIYEQCGSREFNAEARRLMQPGNCPFFEEGKPAGKANQQLALPGSLSSVRRGRLDKGRARELYEAGMDDRQIAEKTGVSPHTVKSWRHSAGLPARNDPRRLSFDERRALALYGQGASDGEIGKAVGATAKTTYMWRVRRGLPSRRQKGRQHG